MNKSDFLQFLRDREPNMIYTKHKSVSARLQGYTTVADQLEWERLKTFLSTSKGRSYFNFTKLDVFIRVTERKLGGVLRPTVDIGNVSSHETGRGHFKEWLSVFESLVQEQNKTIYIENVLTEQFANFWEKRPGYQIVNVESPDRCYWKTFEETLPMDALSTIKDHLREMGFETHSSNLWFRKNLVVSLRLNGDHEMIFTPSPHVTKVIKASFTNESKSLYLALAQIRNEADEWFIEFQKTLREDLILGGKDVPEHLFEDASREA